MSANEFTWDGEAGTVEQDGIRYVLMRPDVLMGVGDQLGDEEAFVQAMSDSAYEHARASFVRYRMEGRLNGELSVQYACEIAAKLGWGRWNFKELSFRHYRVVVSNSPFAEGVDRRNFAVCGWISGVIRAMFAADGKTAIVREVACKAQGCDECRFEIDTSQDYS